MQIGDGTASPPPQSRPRESFGPLSLTVAARSPKEAWLPPFLLAWAIWVVPLLLDSVAGIPGTSGCTCSHAAAHAPRAFSTITCDAPARRANLQNVSGRATIIHRHAPSCEQARMRGSQVGEANMALHTMLTAEGRAGLRSEAA